MSAERVKCCKCGSDDVAVYKREDNALCPACCEKTEEHADGESGHHFDYERDERGYRCRYCYAEPPHDWWGYDPVEP